MSYVDQSRRPSPASMAAVVAIHAATGAALVFGLTITGSLPNITTVVQGINIPIEPPPPPTDPIEKVTPKQPVQPQAITPQPPISIKVDPPEIQTTLFPIPVATPSPGQGTGIVLPKPRPQPGFDPVAARPRNDPSRWLTDRDYRPSWARRELAGLAAFRLQVAANGKVTDCSITRSTGHAELDEATCTLVAKRAKFEPAHGTSGQPVAGSYSGSVMWELPD
ncbi:TonB family protein [Erythrobacter mangrovi]|uniref:TonB family protein n=1 Tax=Erythrobacter mangrovi TaxID=2739433 RepID=A0A7D3X9G4_9SPHN|nr:TonB family protein [Erythrobacter mangrovi]QKG70050.1 TonB family protein [Erythrobacter mangrovi]